MTNSTHEKLLFLDYFINTLKHGFLFIKYIYRALGSSLFRFFSDPISFACPKEIGERKGHPTLRPSASLCYSSSKASAQVNSIATSLTALALSEIGGGYLPVWFFSLGKQKKVAYLRRKGILPVYKFGCFRRMMQSLMNLRFGKGTISTDSHNVICTSGTTTHKIHITR